MKNSYTIILIALFFSGCATFLKPTTKCQPLSSFNTVIISPVTSDETIVEEKKYSQLPPQIAALATILLKEKIEDSRMFKNIIQSSECAAGAIKIDTKISSFIHRRGFHATIRGSIVDCQTNEVIYRFQDVESESNSFKISSEIAQVITKGISKYYQCTQPLQ
jgi:hypothetical protein